MKTPDVFRTDIERSGYGKKPAGGGLSKATGDSKALKAVKPRG
jgi:hypothetical protein